MTDRLLGFFIFWGIWLFVPLLIDGTTAIAYFIGAWRAQRGLRRRRESFQLFDFPTVAIIVPVHNGEDYLARCLRSIRAQTYPQEKLTVVVVDNMSTDRTREVFERERAEPFGGAMSMVTLPFKGKAWALNAGIYVAEAEIVCNVDSDAVLREDAIYNMARAFVFDPGLAAATGSIEVMDVDGRALHPLRYAMAEAEYVEYLVGFRIGRQYQSVTNSLFTLAGAFSCFRRDVLLQTSLYSNLTVSEDTNLTFEIHQKFPHMHILAIPEAVAFVEPAPSLAALYSQRVRWQRGELEVLALYPQLLGSLLRLRGLSTVKSLLIDHTLAFPRVVWTFLFPLMYFMGYPLRLVVSASLSMYIAYVALDALYMAVAYALGDDGTRQRLRRSWWAFLVLPVFRYLTFWSRFAGFLEVLMEPPRWRVADPLAQTLAALVQLRASVLSMLTSVSQSRLVSTVVQLLRGG